MAYLTHHPHRDIASIGAAFASVAGAGLAGVRALGARIGDRLSDIDRRDAERAIAACLARSGGRLTDSMEREIMHKALANDWSLPGGGA